LSEQKVRISITEVTAGKTARSQIGLTGDTIVESPDALGAVYVPVAVEILAPVDAELITVIPLTQLKL